MLNLNTSYLKYTALGFLAILLVFVALLYKQNSITILVTMHTPQQNILNPKIYFSGENEGYSEYNSRIPFDIKNQVYRFDIPNINVIKNLRFDPSTRINKDILIREIKIIRVNWFKTIRYKVALSSIHKYEQIANFKTLSKGVEFSTLGNDPQLHLKFQAHKVSKSYPLPLSTLLMALIIVMILFYLRQLYRTQALSESLNTKVILYTLFLGFILFKTLYYKENIRFGYPPDELMHLKYIQYVEKHPQIVPAFEKMPHYLSHPPLYYQFLSLVSDKNVSTKENIRQYRTLSMMLYILTVVLILYLGFSSSLGVVGHLVYLSVLSSIPMHSYLGGSITNDTLGMLGGIIFILGMKRLLQKRYSTLTYLIIGLGIFIAYFAKLTAALLIFFALVFFLAYMILTKSWIVFKKRDVLLMALILIPILYYQLSIMMQYHALVPTYNATQPEAYLKSGFFVPEASRLHLSPTQWFERMLHYIQGGWFGIHSHHSFGHAQWSGVLGLVLAHILALFAFFFRCKEENRSYCLLGKMTLFAVFSVLVVQFIFSYKSHLSAGYLGGLQPRYLLPFMFAFAIMASLFVERFKQYFLFNLVIIAMCIHAIYSDFFYFLQYYQ
ncbi:MAG: hypothetical protein Q9M36_10590 [Sulfurovum sp.]|nr:hypothetical protein [Sulfurovum sp.]